MDRSDARRLAQALRSELWFTASGGVLGQIAERGGINAGLNPPETEGEEFVELVWRALESIGLADGK